MIVQLSSCLWRCAVSLILYDVTSVWPGMPGQLLGEGLALAAVSRVDVKTIEP